MNYAVYSIYHYYRIIKNLMLSPCSNKCVYLNFITVGSRYNEVGSLANQAFVIRKFVNKISIYGKIWNNIWNFGILRYIISYVMYCTTYVTQISSLYLKKVRYKKKFGIKRVILLCTVYRLTSLNGIQHLISNIRYNKFFFIC